MYTVHVYMYNTYHVNKKIKNYAAHRDNVSPKVASPNLNVLLMELSGERGSCIWMRQESGH